MSFVEFISANASPARRWFRQLFTRQALMDGLKTLTWVVPLTILIWSYAAQQRPIDSEKRQTLQVQFHTTDPDRIITPVNPPDDMITVQLTGPKAAVDNALDAFSKPENSIVRIDVTSTNLKDEPTYLTIADRVRDAEIFSRYGVKVGDVSPSMINVNIDTLKTLEVDVKPQFPDLLEPNPTFVPHTVKITAPSRFIQKAADARENIAAIAQVPVANDTAGNHEGVLVPLKASIQGENITISPASATASYNKKQDDKTADIPSLSILRVFGGGVEDQYSVEVKETNLPVTISGQEKLVAQVIANLNTANPPYAYFRVDSSESSQPSITKALSYNLGVAGVRVLEPNGPNMVTYSVKKRQSGP